MDIKDKRYYTRYRIRLEGKVATEKGSAFPIDVLDLSIEGARLKTDKEVWLTEGDIVYLVIKWKVPIKAKAEVRWIKQEKFNTEFGVRFFEMSIKDRETLSSLISEYALSSLLDTYFR